MLEIALKSKLPVISVATEDVFFFDRVVESITNVQASWYKPGASMSYGDVFMSEDMGDASHSTTMKLAKAGATLVILNPPKKVVRAFDAGSYLPDAKTLSFCLKLSDYQKDIILPHLTGLSVKQSYELIQVVTQVGNELSQEVLREFRSKLFVGQHGLTKIETDASSYIWNDSIKEWVDEITPYFLGNVHPMLRPRGVLVHGHTGAGKTSLSKALAKLWGVPLYRLDLAQALDKYIGVAENRVAAILSQVDKEEPCILLIDEVEKLFDTKADNGVVSRILSQLLWWLAEHKSRVFTVMTSNNIKKLPEELYRAGRIDRDIKIGYLTKDQSVTLIKSTLAETVGLTHDREMEVAKAVFSNELETLFTPSTVMQTIFDISRKNMWKPLETS